MALKAPTLRELKKIWDSADDEHLFNVIETALLCRVARSTLCMARKRGDYMPFETMTNEETNKQIFMYRKKHIHKFLNDTGRVVCKGKIDPKAAYKNRLMRMRLAALKRLGI